MAQAQGTIVQCIGAVIDIQFPRDQMPAIYEALLLEETTDGGLAEKGLTFEVEQQLGDGVVRTIAMGSADGLRGFSINEFSGQRLVRGNFELRSIPLPIWVFRVGTVLFYDVGGAANSFGNLKLNHDVGLLRIVHLTCTAWHWHLQRCRLNRLLVGGTGWLTLTKSTARNETDERYCEKDSNMHDWRLTPQLSRRATTCPARRMCIMK